MKLLLKCIIFSEKGYHISLNKNPLKNFRLRRLFDGGFLLSPFFYKIQPTFFVTDFQPKVFVTGFQPKCFVMDREPNFVVLYLP